MTDIRKTELSVSGLLEVRQGFMTRRKVEVCDPGRKCDGFVYILQGMCHYMVHSGDTFTANAGDILYLANEAVYSMHVDCPLYEFIVADFRFLSSDTRRCFVFTPRNTAETENLFRRMLHSYTSLDPARFSECLSVLYRLYAQLLRSEQTKTVRDENTGKIGQAKQYMDAHLQDPSLQVAELAENAGMSAVYFRRLFRQMYAISPVRYLMHNRIEAAKRLLCYTDIRLEDISARTGYTSLSYFCKVFKDITGQTPTEYRETVKQGQELT